jgi:Uma2 family endonuclease
MPLRECPSIRRFSVDEVFRMRELELFDATERLELIDGLLMRLPKQSPAHSEAVAWITRHLVRGVDDFEVRIQDLLLIEGGFVLPDAMVLARAPRGSSLPSTALLAVEVAVSSLRHDTNKAAHYARAQVGEYWIVDMAARELVVHRRPTPIGYREVTRHADGARVPTPVGAPEARVTELLGPARAGL